MSTYKVIEKLKGLEKVLQESNLHTILPSLSTAKKVTADFFRVSPRSVFVSIDEVEKAFNDFYAVPSNIVISLNDNLLGKSDFVLFGELYERCLVRFPVAENQEDPSSGLSWSARMLKASLEQHLLFVAGIRQQLEQGEEQDPSLKEISLFFEYSYTLKETLVKLEAIQSLYSNLCHLMAVSEDDFPLKINMVETGSLLIKLLGESKIIELLLSLIKDSSGFFYKNNTQQGKIESIPRKIEAIESVVKLKNLLDANGIDTSKMTKNIEESADTVTEQLSVLLAGERIVRINGEVVSTNTKSVQKQLTAKETYLLKSAKEPEGEEPNFIS